MSQQLTDGDDNISGIQITSSVVYALDGNDRVIATDAFYFSVMTLYGGEGNDFVGMQANNSVGFFYGGWFSDTLHGGRLGDELYGETHSDLLVGGEFSLALFTAQGIVRPFADEPSGADYLSGGTGSDALYGFDGNDKLDGDDGNDSVHSIIVPNANGTVRTVLGGLFGGDGNDHLDGGLGDDDLYGGAGNDSLLGGDGTDVLVGGAGIDRIEAGAGNDTVYDGSSADFIDLARGDDSVNAGAGNDILRGGDGTDRISFSYESYDSDDAIDRPVVSTGPGIVVDLMKTTAQNFGRFGVDTISSFEDVDGSGGSDKIYGSNGINYLVGGNGSDLIDGRGGEDKLYGDVGADIFIGGAGRDFITVGGDDDARDWVRYLSTAESGITGATQDTVHQFTRSASGIGDRIDLSRIDANPFLAGNQAFVFRGAAAFRTDVIGEVRFVDAGNHLIVQVDTDRDNGAEMTIFMVEVASLAAYDFVL